MRKLELCAAAVAAAVILTLAASPALPCSRVLWAPGGKAVVVGRTMDWFEDMKTNLWALPRGIERQGAAGNNSLKWTARYGSIVTAVHDMCSTDGINEQGLAANILWLAESDYGKRDESVPGIALSLWAQYMLDNFSSVDEAVEFIKKIPFQPVTAAMPGLGKKATVHLAMADATGDSAIIEYTNGSRAIYHSRQYTVMTNSPPFRDQLANLKQYKAFGGVRDLPGSGQAADRFVRAASYLASLPKPAGYRENVAYIFSVMRNVSVPYLKQPDPSHPNLSSTLWRTVADLTNRVYYFESTLSPNVVWVRLDRMDLKKGAPVKKLDLVKRRDLAGDVSRKFKETKPFVFAAAE